MNRAPLYLALLAASTLVFSACSSDDDDAPKEHVWKDQVETIDKAREVEGMLKGAAGRQKKAADDSGY